MKVTSETKRRRDQTRRLCGGGGESETRKEEEVGEENNGWIRISRKEYLKTHSILRRFSQNHRDKKLCIYKIAIVVKIAITVLESVL